MTLARLRTRVSPRRASRRLRPALLPIVQTAAAAVAAYYVALALPLSDRQPVFASIAAVICLGATYSRRGRRSVELIGGVVLGLTIADLLLAVIGTGPLQIGLMVVLAMGTAVILGGGELFVSEAAISALLLASLHSTGASFSPDRLIEGLTGGAVALVVGSFVLPPDPALIVARAAQRVFGNLGWTLEELAGALADGDQTRAAAVLQTARATDAHVAGLQDTVLTARETARLAPPRRSARDVVERYARTVPHVDHAVRNARVLARHGLRYSRTNLPAPEGLVDSVRDLAQAVWALAAAYEDPERGIEARGLALQAAGRAREAFEGEPDLGLTEIVGQIRSTAVDVARAAELATGAAEPVYEVPTEEMLAVPNAPAA
ncbi:MAG: hypothetical protein QOI62_1662 [Solirubrobacteraceae bacterium]|jgi:uncharacterized membrane protein YgaE (UPF0421/DUF939 family)|nr:hypothetical protein [Solirubrobacteraceae bacterium]MEA2358402.1 hypothetical protein [Solirubrobacteraceae bacterium]MEA2392651.1 hypothetical protein [Solirubrobacteraceae bacterium]